MSNELLRSVGFSFNGADENYRERERSLSGQNRKHGVEERYQTRRRDRYHQARVEDHKEEARSEYPSNKRKRTEEA